MCAAWGHFPSYFIHGASGTRGSETEKHSVIVLAETGTEGELTGFTVLGPRQMDPRAGGDQLEECGSE